MIDTKNKSKRNIKTLRRRYQAQCLAREYVAAVCRMCKADPDLIERLIRESRQSIGASKSIPESEQDAILRSLDRHVEALANVIEDNRKDDLEEIDLFPLDNIDEWGHITRCP